MAPYLLAFFSTFFALALFWPTLRLWREHRVNALVLPSDDSAHGLVGRLFKGTILAAFMLLVSLGLGLSLAVIGPLSWLESSTTDFIGWVLLAASLLWIVVAQAQMGASWRIGIDSGSHTELVTGGIFQLSRNPIFLGMRLSLLGLFLVLPNAVTLAILVLGEALMQVQVRLEEEHLGALHGEAYVAYRKRVRRWA